jgi:hypothetical protein
MMKLCETNVCCERFQPFTISDLSGILKMSAELARTHSDLLQPTVAAFDHQVRQNLLRLQSSRYHP